MLYAHLVLPLLSRLDAEAAHHGTLALLRLAQRAAPARRLLRRRYAVDDPRLVVHAFGLTFPNPVGLAAGFDKDALAFDALAAFGFGHVEVGTIVPRPQPGRDRPRVFRLPRDRALINRLGFPSRGLAEARRRLAAGRERGYVLGANVGPNATSVAAGAAQADYRRGIAALAPVADYLTINVSSPNTRGLRLLQASRALDAVLAASFAALDGAPARPPILLKVAPDLTDTELDDLLRVAASYPVGGFVATNTTVTRPATLVEATKGEDGGLSGRPLRERSTAVIRAITRRTQGRFPIIGVGGVFTADDALQKIRAGACLVQVYTGLVYQGPALAQTINKGLLAHLRGHGAASLAPLVGSDA